MDSGDDVFEVSSLLPIVVFPSTPPLAYVNVPKSIVINKSHQ
jgi:hypothetical protein